MPETLSRQLCLGLLDETVQYHEMCALYIFYNTVDYVLKEFNKYNTIDSLFSLFYFYEIIN